MYCKALLFVSIIIWILIGNSSHVVASSSIVGMTNTEISEKWGSPQKDIGAILVYEKNQIRLIAAYSLVNGKNIVTDYLIINSKRNYIDGTIPSTDSILNVMNQILTNDVKTIERVYDDGSGNVLYAKITYEGYIVSWLVNRPSIIGLYIGWDGVILDSISLKDYTPLSLILRQSLPFFIKGK